MLQDVTGTDADVYYGFLEACLRHKSEMVVFEAAKYVCSNNSHSLLTPCASEISRCCLMLIPEFCTLP